MYKMNREYWEYYAYLKRINPKKAKSFKSKYLKTTYIPCENKWTIIHFGDEDIIEKRFFPYHFTEEEKTEFINDTWEHIYSLYDCTGEWFTISIKIFEVKNGTWVYHWKGIDC